MKDLGTNTPDLGELMGFGEPPAYTRTAVLGAALLSILGGLAHAVLGAIDLNARLWPAMLYLGLDAALFVFGILLLIRFVEARDAMTDPSPRVRMYDRHERTTYLGGLAGALACLLAGLLWLGAVRWGPWHLLPGAVTVLTAWAYLRLWRAKR